MTTWVRQLGSIADGKILLRRARYQQLRAFSALGMLRALGGHAHGHLTSGDEAPLVKATR
jgi:hypothetical protein